jgi:hypothetical protein
MKALFLMIVLCLAVGVVFGKAPAHAAKDSDIEVVEEIEVVETEEGAGAGVFLGIHKHRWLTITGPIIWLAMALAILTRYIRIKEKMRQLFKAHKICGYTAFCAGTCHGLIALLL